MMKARVGRPRRMLTILLVLTSMILVALFSFFRLIYISDEIKSGEKYGLAIGESKRQAFAELDKVAAALETDLENLFVEVRADEAVARATGVPRGAQVMRSVSSEGVRYEDLSQRTQWDLYIGPRHRNFLRITFCGEVVCRLYRHRNYFELP